MSEAKTEKSKSKFKVIDLVYIGLSAALIAVCSWISIPLPTVPITLQTMGVVLIASLFGAKRGVIATVVYILLGAIGVPVFSGFSSGRRCNRRIYYRLYFHRIDCRHHCRQNKQTLGACCFNDNRHSCLLCVRHRLVCNCLYKQGHSDGRWHNSRYVRCAVPHS